MFEGTDVKWLCMNQILLYPPLIPCLELKQFRELGYFVFPFHSYDVFVLLNTSALSGTLFSVWSTRIQRNTPCNFFLVRKAFFCFVGILAYRIPDRKDFI